MRRLRTTYDVVEGSGSVRAHAARKIGWIGASALIASLAACASTPDEVPCDRACLIELAHGVATGETELSAARITENGVELAAAQTWLASATEVNIHGEYAAADAGQVIVLGTGLGGDGRPGVFGLRLLQRGYRMTEAELIVAHEGEASLFPPATPIPRQAVFSEPVAADARAPRARMIELADAYFDGIEIDSGANVPVTDDCERIENGVQTTHSERFSDLACNSLEPFDYIPEVRERRYPIVDEERGVVVGLVAFYIPGGDYPRVVDGMMTTRHYEPRSLFLMEGFKIEGDELRLIEATMRDMPLGTSMGWAPE